ncbi:sel1 repeat family protein [Pseudovibrio sp. Tun.PSC04-5.I4]|uniref:sel1 repeat family protein n=1 Tax=Pseudovibrio sp. Tun.PSC04-5.I4 TaxID=1798213 RepID=UPI00117A4AD2|nr:sel1 repeat family protein [Pseudovibrio sp. Tun.PSC04-5.I4]
MNGDPETALDAARELEYSRLDQDMKMQERLYKVAANAGLLFGQIDLAKKYIFGSEFSGDYERAIDLLRSALRKHGALNAHKITRSLSGGKTLKELLAIKNSNMRDWDSKLLTAVNFSYGLTIPQNTKIAELLLRSEPDEWQYSPAARYTLAQIIFSEDDPSAERVKEALQELIITANSGYVSGQVKLAELYELGLYVEKDFKKAALWYRIAGSKLPRIKVHLAKLILEGKVAANYGEDALEILTRAAENLDPTAIEALVQYWAKEQNDGYDHERWMRRQKLLN